MRRCCDEVKENIMAYILTIILVASSPAVSMQEFSSRTACQNQMHYLEAKLLEAQIPTVLLSCSPKGDIK